jgi:SAM-dependent methyltransferase
MSYWSERALFLMKAIRDICGFEEPRKTRVLDFGAGRGFLVAELQTMGFDVFGCDIEAYWNSMGRTDHILPEDLATLRSRIRRDIDGRLKIILQKPYRLPFEDNSFDVVLSTSVLEHVNNKRDCFLEIKRVMTPGGYSMHCFPGRWYLPYEPHLHIPLLNIIWPKVPLWYLRLWATIGFRPDCSLLASPKNKTTNEVVEANYNFCRDQLSYWSTEKYTKLSMDVFGNYSWPMDFYIDNAPGGYAKLCRRLPMERFWGLLGKEFREAFLVQHKTLEPVR